MAANSSSYDPPLALTIISSVSIGIAAVAALWIALDILLRRGWRSMMAIMIPVYVVNALYLWPLTLWTYIKYGRPPKPDKQHGTRASTAHRPPHAQVDKEAGDERPGPGESSNDSGDRGDAGGQHQSEPPEKGQDEMAKHGQHCHSESSSSRPMFATVTVAVCHCGAGCMIGDIVGEWLVYGTDVTINGRALWPAYLIDFAFAIALGIVFQYYSIAPMAGEYGPKILYRAAKADFLSLLFFEIGLFGWMAIFQVAIFRWELEMNTVTYWWMMQIGMFLGHWTAVPINWWLIKKGVKEPCA